jgi:hypothetical protein
MSTLKTLRQLHTIIGDAISKIETDFDANALDWPSLDNPHVLGRAEAAASTPHSVDACNRIVAAAEQLTATVRGPAFTLFDASMGVSEAARSHDAHNIFSVSSPSLPAVCGTDTHRRSTTRGRPWWSSRRRHREKKQSRYTQA